MSIKRIDVKPRMSAIVEHNETIYLSGQIAKDDSKDIKEQTKTTLEKIEELIQQGKVVICQCPNKTILRNAVKHFVHERQGQIEFSDSDQLAVYCKELGPDYEFI